MDALKALCDLDAPVIFFPVRHHSPTSARIASELIDRLRPAIVLIEGPSDFNDRLDELRLKHKLPIAIYSYVHQMGGQRRGAFYPYCDYSPEWQAIHVAQATGADVRFIDLPWADVAEFEEATHRYADAELRRGAYVRHLCETFGVEDFDALWDKLFEADAGLGVEEYLKRAHQFCLHARLWEAEISESDRRREAFMAAEIHRTSEKTDGQVVVVTGGFHCSALYARLHGQDGIRADHSGTYQASSPRDDQERGIALTPYSYDRLDNLSGYDAGMPSPGFYHRVWHDRRQGHEFSFPPLLGQVASKLRKRKQVVSTADLIAVETTAHALAAIRGRTVVWRQDLLDAVRSALVKEELEYGCESPFLNEVLRIFRGNRRGELAKGTQLPPLVRDIQNELSRHELQFDSGQSEVELDLLQEADRQQSRVLHRLSLLKISGYRYLDGTDFSSRKDLSQLWELWEIRWSPDFDATCIEAACYGPTLEKAASEYLAAQLLEAGLNAEGAAAILLKAALAGIQTVSDKLVTRLEILIRQDNDFLNVSAALSHLLFLYCYDETLATSGDDRFGNLLSECVARAVWLLESLGDVSGREKGFLHGISVVLETFVRAGDELELERDEFQSVLLRVTQDDYQSPVVRGAALGALWTSHAANDEQISRLLTSFADPSQLGDFLTGLFFLAREVAQRHPSLVGCIDALLTGFSADEFLHALPSLRLAFTYFTPREKHHMLITLFESLGMRDAKPLELLEVDSTTAAAALTLETRLYEVARRYGVRTESEA